MCLQRNDLLPNAVVTGSEDCLYLNVYKPNTTCNKIPVMVYIHGGGFFSGTASPSVHGPEYFMDTKKVIIVVISYRLGVLGNKSFSYNFIIVSILIKFIFLKVFCQPVMQIVLVTLHLKINQWHYSG